MRTLTVVSDFFFKRSTTNQVKEINMKPDFMDRIEKIITDVRTRTCIDKLDTEVLEVIEDILQAGLSEYHNEVYTYGRNTGYDEGYALGYMSSSAEAIERSYYAGYDDGYSDGHDDGINAETRCDESWGKHERLQH